jgi:hypothetical protein
MMMRKEKSAAALDEATNLCERSRPMYTLPPRRLSTYELELLSGAESS